MLDQRSQAVERLAAKLFAAEKALDLALAEIADVAGQIPRTRMEAGLALAAGQPAMEHMADALTGMAKVRAAVIAAHAALEHARRRYGLPEVRMMGGGDKEHTGGGTKPTGLRQVA
jgi:uncharacterized protein YutE (UPF0331/DUF86 family)